MAFQQLIWMVICGCVPAYCLLSRRHTVLVAWLCISLSLECIALYNPININAFRAGGLVVIGSSMVAFQKWSRTPSGKWMLLHLFSLALLGMIFGFLFPWPDETLSRPLTQLAQGRSVIYLVRNVCDVSAALFIAAWARTHAAASTRILKFVLIGTSIAALGVVLEYSTGADLFHALTGGRELLLEVRLRGFNGEPRVSGQVCAFGILILVILQREILARWRLLLGVLHLFAFMLTTSTAGLATLTVGMLALLIMRAISWRDLAVVVALGLCATLAGGMIEDHAANWKEAWVTNIEFRTAGSSINGDGGLEESLVSRLEVFDASATRFLLANPLHLITGAGPGLVSLPASAYMSRSERDIFGDRIDSVPHMGAIMLIADSGFIGLLVWLCMCMSCVRALRWRVRWSRYGKLRDHRYAYIGFVVFTSLYCLQSRETWFVFLGLGIAAVMRERRRSIEMFRPAPLREPVLQLQ